MTRAIKIEWEERKERGTCKFVDIKPGKYFTWGDAILKRVPPCLEIRSSNVPFNAIGITCPGTYNMHLDIFVQPVTIRKVVLRK